MTRFRWTTVCLVTLLLSACNNVAKVIPQPGVITLENALKSVGTGLRELQSQNLKTGLIASEVDVVFNITANAKDTQNGNLYVEAGATPANVVAVTKAGGNLGFTGEITAQRGNTITIKFRNLLSLSTDNTLAGKVTPEQLNKWFGDIKVFIFPPPPP